MNIPAFNHFRGSIFAEQGMIEARMFVDGMVQKCFEVCQNNSSIATERRSSTPVEVSLARLYPLW